MPLSEYKPVVETVDFPGGSFTVRAISLPDVALLIDIHEHVISSLVEKVQNRKEIWENADNEEAIRDIVVDLATELIRESPILVANLIAICADEQGAMNAASRLPITIQVDALNKIAKLTFTDMASVKKLAADVMSMVRGILPTANPRRMKRK